VEADIGKSCYLMNELYARAIALSPLKLPSVLGLSLSLSLSSRIFLVVRLVILQFNSWLRVGAFPASERNGDSKSFSKDRDAPGLDRSIAIGAAG